MTRFRASTVVLAGVVLALHAAAQPSPTESLKPLTICVVDAETDEPLPAFEYQYRVVTAAGERAALDVWTPVASPEGTVTLHLPVSCGLTFVARAPGHNYGVDSGATYVVHSKDANRRFRHALVRDLVITGRVMDAASHQPIAGVRVSPLVFHNPSFDPDHDRSVFTDSDGHFEIGALLGLFGSVMFEHPEYQATSWGAMDTETLTTRPSTDLAIELNAGAAIAGLVHDADGVPIGGALVRIGGRTEARSGDDGTFRFGGLSEETVRGGFSLDVTCPGYMEYLATAHPAADGRYDVTLTPLLQIRGRVVDGEGRPVRSFTLFTGPGAAPAAWQCQVTPVQSADGTFTIGLDTGARTHTYPPSAADAERTHWFGVRADGYAFWQDVISLEPPDAPLEITLEPGVRVTGQLAGFGSALRGGTATLTLQCPGCFACDVGTAEQQRPEAYTVPIDAAGKLCFEHVRPDDYVLSITGQGLARRVSTVEVPPHDLRLPTLEVQRAGRIVGRIYDHCGAPASFVVGVVYHNVLGRDARDSFTTDEDGRFNIEAAPGDVGVGTQCMVSDFICTDLVRVRVVSGEIVEATVNPPEDPPTGEVGAAQTDAAAAATNK